MQYLKLAKLKIPDPVKWHSYVLWTYRVIKFQWWRSEPKGTIYTRSDEGRFLLPTQHSIIQWLWVVTATCLGRGSSLLFSLSRRFSTAYAFYRRLPSFLLLCRGLLLGLLLSAFELNCCSFTIFFHSNHVGFALTLYNFMNGSKMKLQIMDRFLEVKCVNKRKFWSVRILESIRSLRNSTVVWRSSLDWK